MPFVIPDRNRSVNVNIDNLGDGINVKDNFACPPSDNPSQLGESGIVGQGPVVPCGLKPLASQGSLDPAPLMVAGELPSHTGQPPQALATPKLGELFKTPCTARSKLGSARLTPGVYSTLRAVLEEHEDATKEEKMHLMLQSLIDSDPSFKGSLSSCRSGRSGRSEGTEKSRKSKGERVKSTKESRRISLTRENLEVTPIAGCSSDPPNKLELTREWARMVQTGGVTVKTGTSCFFKDKEGIDRFVKPPDRKSFRGKESGTDVRVYGLFGCPRVLSLWRRRPRGGEEDLAISGVGKGNG